MITIICCIWWWLGICGYFMIRQGFLVEFERALGKKGAWNWADVVWGLIYTLYGPIVILKALKMSGKRCFRKRNTRKF